MRCRLLKEFGYQKVTRITSVFSTNFSSQVLKTSARRRRIGWRCISDLLPRKKKPPGKAALLQDFVCTLSRNLFQSLLVDIEVGMHILHVIALFERFEQPDHLRRLLPFQFDVRVGNHAHA